MYTYKQEYIRRRKESVVLRIAAYKCTLKSAKVKLHNTIHKTYHNCLAQKPLERVWHCGYNVYIARNDKALSCFFLHDHVEIWLWPHQYVVPQGFLPVCWVNQQPYCNAETLSQHQPANGYQIVELQKRWMVNLHPRNWSWILPLLHLLWATLTAALLCIMSNVFVMAM